MKANENKLVRFMEGYDKNFLIPVYQRNYDWKEAQCKQLFDDLLSLIEQKRKHHFFGSIVYIYNDNSTSQELYIIDGQQRITTVSLLLLAISNIYKEYDKDNSNIRVIDEEYLYGKYTGKEKLKLKLIKKDFEIFHKLCNNPSNEIFESSSNIIQNYLFFREKLLKLFNKNKDINDINNIFEAIKKLDIVDVKLISNEDNPQLIFESLNSTGLDLTEADKIRNLILMNLPFDLQTKYYENYWNEIEKLKNSDWVKKGFDYLNEENKCPFCQQEISQELIKNLNKVFDEEYNKDIENLKNLLDKYKKDIRKIDDEN